MKKIRYGGSKMQVKMIEFKTIEIKEGTRDILIPIKSDTRYIDYASPSMRSEIETKKIFIKEFRKHIGKDTFERVYVGGTREELQLLGIEQSEEQSIYVKSLERTLKETEELLKVKTEMYSNLACRNYDLLEKLNEFEKITFLGWIKYLFSKKVI